MLHVNCTSIFKIEIKRKLQYDVVGCILPITAVHGECIHHRGEAEEEEEFEGFTLEVTSEVMVKSHGEDRKGPSSVAAAQWIREEEAGKISRSWVSTMLYVFIHNIPSH